MGVSNESSERERPTTARVEDQVFVMSSFAASGTGGTSENSASVVEIWGIGSPPNVLGCNGDIALSWRMAAFVGVMGGAVVTLLTVAETLMPRLKKSHGPST